MNNKLIEFIQQKSILVGISSPEVVFAKSVVDNKNSDKTLFVCEGLWAVEKLIEKKLEVISFLFNNEIVTNLSEKDERLVEKILNYSKNNFAISTKACKKISDREGFDNFFIIAKAKEYSLNDLSKMFKKNALAIITDGLEQPGNVGAILRSFDCAGGDFVIMVNKKASHTNSRAVRSSLGACFTLPVAVDTIENVQNWLQENNFKCILTDLQSTKSYREADYSGKIAIVSGNEHTGISNSWRSLKNAESIIIPMSGSCESLNVGFATTLVAYEAGLQKLNNKK